MIRERSSNPVVVPLRRANERSRLGLWCVVFLAPAALIASVLVVFGPGLLKLLALVPSCFALGVAGGLLLLQRARRNAARPALAITQASISLVDASAPSVELISLAKGFGLNVLWSALRDRVVLAVTNPERVVCIGAPITASRALRDVIRHAVTAPSDDLTQAAILPDGRELTVSPDGLVALFGALRKLDDRCTGRCFLSDATGAALVLDGKLLRTDRCTFDLSRPFEWRASVFHERAGGPIGAAFQATWIRQDDEEIALVSLLGEDARTSIVDAMRRTNQPVDESLLRDADLSNAPPGPAPPQELRVAVDRLFMIPIRCALDRANPARSTNSLR